MLYHLNVRWFDEDPAHTSPVARVGRPVQAAQAAPCCGWDDLDRIAGCWTYGQGSTCCSWSGTNNWYSG
jgi:hypothetical protein